MGENGMCLWMPWRRNRNTPNGHGVSVEYRQPLHQETNPEPGHYVSFFSIAKNVLFTRRRLRITPNKHLHFLYEPGKQVSSAFEVKNTSRSFVAFKLLTNSPKGCFMRTSSCILQPGETVIASVVKFIEPLESKRPNIKESFRVVSLKVRQGVQYNFELFEEQKELVTVEKNLEVVYLDPLSKSHDIEKLKKRLAEAEAAQQAHKKPDKGKVQKTVAAGGAVNEWKEQQRERQQGP